MTGSQLDELESRLEKVYKEEAERHEGNTSLEGLMGYEMGDLDPIIQFPRAPFWLSIVESELSLRSCHSLVIKEEADRQVGSALAADWVGDKKVTSDFKQMYKLKLNKVRKN
ncbi:uncharacterized protein [Branchiostoma lanceolatum]|uniref:uncharacterized protein n=1 Tax=Branchiostoma lanceolatum TaxID=7740 RepID=UPI0034525C8E